MFIKKLLLVTFFFHFYNCELQIRVKTFKNEKKSKRSLLLTFIDFYWLIWITNEKKFIKKIIFSDVYRFISTIVNYKYEKNIKR